MKTALALVLICAPASGQALNVDFGSASGVPAATYGGAAFRCGTWNAIAGTPANLLDLAGDPTSVSLTIVSDGGLGFASFDAPEVTGGDAALYEDFEDVLPTGSTTTYTFSGLADGSYSVVTYAWSPLTTAQVTRITVPGALEPPQEIGGAWPGTHAYLTTFAAHSVDVVGGALQVVVTAACGLCAGALNGFQISPRESAVGVPYCTAMPNTSGNVATLAGVGSPSVVANDLTLRAMGLPIGAAHTGLFITSPDPVQVPLGGGNLCVGPQTLGFVVRLFPAFTADPLGAATLTLDHAAPPVPAALVTPGSTWNYQAWFRDFPPGGAGFNFSTGLAVTYCP